MRGLARFGANGAKTCIFVLFEHFGELAKAACAPKLLKESSKNFFVFQHVPATPISAGSYGRLFLPPLILPLTAPRHLILFWSEMTLFSRF